MFYVKLSAEATKAIQHTKTLSWPQDVNIFSASGCGMSFLASLSKHIKTKLILFSKQMSCTLIRVGGGGGVMTTLIARPGWG